MRDEIHSVMEQETRDVIRPEELTVVIPTLNEAEAIGKVIDELKSYEYNNILVVDGHSMDRTADIARERGARVVLQETNGKGGALRTAIKLVQTPYMLVMDGDYTYNPMSIKNLLQFGETNDEVIGVRRNRENIPLLNRIGNWILNRTFKLLIGSPSSDVCSGMYLLRTEFARQIAITAESFDVEVEIAAQAATQGTIAEAPVDYRRRVGRRKLRPFKDGLSILASIVWMANRYNPVFLYSAIASLSAVPGTIIIIWVVYENLFNRVWHSGFALFGVMLMLLATQAIAVMVISLLIKRVERRIADQLRNLRGGQTR